MDMKERGFDYSIRIAELVRFLREEGKGFPLEDKLLSCGVAVGLSLKGEHPEEKDYRTAAENIRESDYLIEMAAAAGYISEEQTVYIRGDAKKLLELIQQEAYEKKHILQEREPV